MSKFSVGDRVVSVINAPENNERIHVGSAGVVCQTGTWRVAVCWDDYVGGHSCDGHCTDGHGWWIDEDNVELDKEADDEPFEFNENEFNELVFGV